VVELTKLAEVDMYTFQVSQIGEAFEIRSSTPSIGLSGFTNRLDPVLTVLDPDGNAVAFDNNSAADGKNALLQLIAASTGTYTLVVSAATSQAGEYVLSVTPSATPSPKRSAADPIGKSRSEGDSKAILAYAVDPVWFARSPRLPQVVSRSQVVDGLLSDSALDVVTLDTFASRPWMLPNVGVEDRASIGSVPRSSPLIPRSNHEAIFGDLYEQLYESVD